MFQVSRILKSKKNRASIAVVMALMCLTVGSVSAYFTDADTKTNTFTFGQVKIDLEEPNWPSEIVENVTPLQEISKNPQITNEGINDAFVFLTVTVPYKNVVTANADGTRNEASDTELFSWTANSGWEMLERTKDTKTNTVTYLYAYAAPTLTMTSLAKNTTTTPLFDKVTVANVIEDQGLELTTQDIVVNAYAIQTNNINGGTTQASAVWNVVNNQSPDVNIEVPEDAITDNKKG